MKATCFALLALAIAGYAQADRPIVIEESATLESPNSSWTVLGKFGVAIDGDDALVSAERFVPDENAEGGIRHDGAALLYRRANATTWNYVGTLGPVGAITEWVKPALAMKGGVAMVIIDSVPHIFERSGTTWTESSFAGSGTTDLQGHDIEIDSGRILVSRVSCLHNSVVIAKSGGTWRIQGELQGQTNDCGDNPPGSFQDLEGDRALIFNDLGIGPEPKVLRVYRPDESGAGWRQLAEIQHDNVDAYWGPEMAVAGMFTAVNRSREFGTQIYHEVNQSWSSTLFNTLQPVEGYLQPEATSGSGIKRVFGTYFAQRNYSFDRGAYVVNLFSVNQDIYYSTSNIKTLQAKQGRSLGDRIDSTSATSPFHQRIIVSGRTDFGGDNTVRIFEMPEGEKITVQRHDFESDGELAEWNFVPGSSFSIVWPTGPTTRVLRQSSTAGDAGAWLPSSTATAGDHSIQADVTVRSFNGADRWVGLVTRRTDAANYYYVTLRSSGVVQIRRLRNGAITVLASAPATVQTGRKYRLRLESIGTALRVYLDERKVLTAYDSTLTSGDAGVQMYRTSADFDNVIVTPSARATLYTQNFSQDSGPANWHQAGTWTVGGGVFRQTSISGDARAVIGTGTADQIVQVRVRATSFRGASSWVGVIARYADDGNYLYVSLRPNNTVTVRRLVNGQIQEMANLLPGFPITPGRWYTVRIEIVKDWMYVYVDGVVMYGVGAPFGPYGPNPGGEIGKVGLVTYRAAAEYDDFVAYQP